MDRHNEVFGGMVQRVFGPDARLAGSIGTVKRPGELRIVVGRRVLGTGPTFAAALQDAQRQVRKEHTAD